MILKRDEAFMAICGLLTGSTIGTGMFVSTPAGEDKSYCWFVTASHVARTCNSSTIVVESTKDGKAAKLPFSLFCNPGSWIHHPIADISCIQIMPNERNIPFIQKHLFPYDHFFLDKKPVSRDAELTCIGFPRGLGIDNDDGFYSPLTFRSYASSGFLTLNRADTHTPSTFFCLENPSVGGYSGCPVFDLGYSTNGIMTMTKEQTWCHGIMHGTMSDETGGKIALVTPAFYLKDILK